MRSRAEAARFVRAVAIKPRPNGPAALVHALHKGACRSREVNPCLPSKPFCVPRTSCSTLRSAPSRAERIVTGCITTEALLERSTQRGLSDGETARRTLRATLAVLGQRLVDDEAAALADVLPSEMASAVENVEYDADFDSADFYERVARRTLTPAGNARELAEIVIGALGECLDEDLRVRLARALLLQIAAVLLGRQRGESPPPH